MKRVTETSNASDTHPIEIRTVFEKHRSDFEICAISKRLAEERQIPRRARTQQEIESIRATFLDVAVRLFAQQGYKGFSIRQLARDLGIAGATLYHYFPGGKDELYLLVATKGYEHLFEKFQRAYQRALTPREKVTALALAYLEYAFEHPNDYSLLFSSDAPKYSDYLGKPLQPVAEVQNEAALRVAAIASRALEEATGVNDKAELRFRILQLWSMLHGVASLKNSRVTLEVGHMSPQLIDRYLRESLEAVLPRQEPSMCSERRDDDIDG